jgi:predicted RNase H-like HicB family nuclease
MEKTKRQFTAVFRKAGKWYLAWIEEIPGVNTQGKTLKEAKENLHEALLLILETNRTISSAENYGSKLTREKLSVVI